MGNWNVDSSENSIFLPLSEKKLRASDIWNDGYSIVYLKNLLN
jgi:hypothetical protein